jgi:hypothetical protein
LLASGARVLWPALIVRAPRAFLAWYYWWFHVRPFYAEQERHTPRGAAPVIMR